MMATSTYQLKWHSHSSHLNGSVGALLQSERFTDVVLCTLDGSQIPAHKFILSSCSVYLSSLFEGQRSVTRMGGMLYVVLPSEISTKALKILVEYMYKGEITIDNEDLDSIMKAGNVLKVQGIWKNIRAGCDPDLTITPEKTSRIPERHVLSEPPTLVFYKTAETLASTEPSSTEANVTSVATNSVAYKIASDLSTLKNLDKHIAEDKDRKPTCERNQNHNLEGSLKSFESHADISVELEMKVEPGLEINNIQEEPSIPDDVKSEMDEVTVEEVTIETPTLSSHQHPVKRKRSNKDDAEDAVLRCDLCREQFSGAGEWIRHIQSTHMDSASEQEPSQLIPEYTPTPELSQSLLVPLQPQEPSQNHLLIQPLPTRNADNEEVVAREDYYGELRKYYKSQSQLSTKPEWTSDRINQVINLIELFKYPQINQQKTSQQYHYASKYDVVYVGDLKYLVTKPKSGTQVKQILPSEEYYDHILHVHLLTGHGGRDKIIRNLRKIYVIPQFAIMIFLNLCKHCKLKKICKLASQISRPLEVTDRQTVPNVMDINNEPLEQSSLSSD